MERTDARLDALTRPQRVALRRLLVRATAVAGRSSDVDELDQLVRNAPIDALPDAAALHRVAGSVLRGLTGVEGVPEAVRLRLDAIRKQSSLRHLLISAELGHVGRAFDEAGLAWAAMKGPVVAALLYPEVGDRTYNDLDLLVDRRDFPQATRILEDLGYAHLIHNWALAEEVLAGEIQMSRQLVCVDLHWHLHFSRQDRRPFALDPEAMVSRARQVVVSGVTAPTLDSVDTLLTLAFHAARSDGHRLVWLKDIERSIAVENPDLDELVRRSRGHRCAPPVGVVLARARALLGADIPKDIVESLTPMSVRTTDRFVSTLNHPVQLHDRLTVTRMFTRSVRSSIATSIVGAPTRAARRVQRQFFPPAENETDSPVEKASYLDAVAGSINR